MKILRLRFKNINSFYGEHDPIDFREAPLSTTGLFIISGPTGAGKSTLLDVISLALFNEVPRFGRTVSKSEIDRHGSVVNLKAVDEKSADAYAEVEYEAKGEQYRSRWSIAKNRNGNWNNYQMEIAELPSEKLLDVKRLSDYPDENARLIGLNYQQFIQSIILAQGSFAEFLKADRNVRGRLLEDITGTHIYRELGIAAFEKDKKCEKELREKEAEMKGVQLLEEADIQKLNEQLREAQKQKAQAEEQFAYWDSERILLEDCAKLQGKLGTIKQDKIKVNQRSVVFSPSHERLKRHESVSAFASELTQLKERKSLLDKLKKKAIQLGEETGKLAKDEAGLLSDCQSLTSQAVSLETLREVVGCFEQEIQAIQKEISELRASAAPLMDAVQSEIKGSRIEFIRTLPAKDFNLSTQILGEKENEQREKLSFFSADADLDETLETLEFRERTIDALVGNYKERTRLKTEGGKKREQVKAAKAEIARLEPILENLTKELEALSENIELLSAQRDRELTQQNFDEQRGQLKADEACPLCGSLHHPFVHTYVSNLLALQDKLQKSKSAQKEKQKEEKTIANKLLTARKEVELLDPELESMVNLHKNIGEIMLGLAAQIELQQEVDELYLATEKEAIKNEYGRIKAYQGAREATEVILRLQQHFVKLIDCRDSVSRREQDRTKRYAGKNIQADANQFRQHWQDLKNATATNTKATKTNQEEQSETEKTCIELETQLLENLSGASVTTPEEAQARLLDATEYQKLKRERDEISDQTKKLDTLEKDLNQNLLEKTNARKVVDLPLEEIKSKAENCRLLRDQHFGEESACKQQLLTDHERRQRYATFQRAISDLRRERQKWELLKRYIGDSSGNSFSNFSQSLTLSNLVGLANQRLATLSDRYVLDKPRGESDSLFVLDTYQGNAPRAVATLSGGETFTISLALALALSDLASRNVRIESLFIDEGFGTLDPESLETALATLEQLQADSQKTVGVISHRHEMKDRIPVQIQVEKGIDGTSRVKLIGG